MCRYEYGNGKCAHPNNLSLDCVGEGTCVYDGDSKQLEKVEEALSTKLDNQQDDKCPNTQCGLYCEKYNRFYCAGEKNCNDKEEYFEHMKTFGGIDIGESDDHSF